MKPFDDPSTSAALPSGDEAASVTAELAARSDARVGPYHLVRVLGEGGFGVVYLAERREPFHQEVALKVLKPGMDSAAVLARFELERRALAIMDHPGIARVLDGGLTDATSRLGPGRPYFVMELVRGSSITDYCREQGLTIQDRLDLFLLVCDAVQHAHTKGVIHRDLKPSNILVAEAGGRAVPKVIDFGVAKALSSLRLDQTMTVTGQFIGTPEYMSPEQAGGMGAAEDIDTRADVYSLGVVLYKLLTGVLPFEPDQLWKASLLETMRVIREVDPLRPSTRVESMGRADAADARTVVPGAGGSGGAGGAGGAGFSPVTGEAHGGLARRLRGDLDWICMRALEKPRDRRYQSPGALAADIRRYLRTEPVEAGPPGAAYRIGKFIRRRKALVTAGGLGLAAVVAGLVLALMGLFEARYQQRRAEESLVSEKRQASRAKEAFDVFSRATLQHGGHSPGDPGLTVSELLQHIDKDLQRGGGSGDPELRSELLLDFGEMHRSLGELGAAERLFESARRDAARPEGAFPFLHARATVSLARIRNDQNRPSEALALADEAVGWLGSAPDAESALLLGRALTAMGSALHRLDRRAEAAERYRLAVSTVQSRLGGGSSELINPLSKLAEVLCEDPATRREALETAEQAVTACELAVAAETNDSLLVSVYNTLGRARRDNADLAGAADAFSHALNVAERIDGLAATTVASTQHNLAVMLRELGRGSEAVPLVEKALANRRVSAPGSPALAASIDMAALLEADRDNLDGAERLYREDLAIVSEMDVGSPLDVARAQTGLADVLTRLGRFDEAARLAEKALKARKKGLAPDEWPTLNTQSVLAAAVAGQGDLERAVTLIDGALTKMRTDPSVHRTRLIPVLGRAIGVYERAKNEGRAAECREEIGALKALSEHSPTSKKGP